MSTSLLLGIHCHQPVDNFGYVVKNAIEKSYKPFFNVLKEFPDIKISVHYSGWLLEFIEKHDKELFSLMKSLSSQLEFFSGGFYEPVLASIPSRDRIAQIKKLNSYIKKHFKQEPKGLWLTERVWDNSIIKDLKECGIEYVIVDDYHLIASGYDRNNLNGYFVTEEGGEKIALFPISKTLRYAIPFYDNDRVNHILKEFGNEDGKNAAVIFDDGEKFGIWPKTYETVYEKEWLKNFFQRCIDDESIVVETYEEFYSRNKPITLTYLPTVSYQEMGEWALKADDTITLEKLIKTTEEGKEFLKGGIWKNFLTKYQEANWIHKRVLELSSKQTNDKTFKDNLYRAQCNDVLWHGVFGGVYLPNLRDNAYKYIIECEKSLDIKEEEVDIDLDGYYDYKINTGDLTTIVALKHGGHIYELDINDISFNLQNTLTRYKEAYHEKIEVKTEEEVGSGSDEVATIHDNILKIDEAVDLDYDWYLKKSAIDHICDEGINIEKFSKSRFNEYGDFANQPFVMTSFGKSSLQIKREGGIYQDGIKHHTTIEKTFAFKNNEIKFDVGIATDIDRNYRYLNEWNLHFPNVENVEFNGQVLEEFLIFNEKKLIIKDKLLGKKLTFSFDDEIEIFISLLNSVSQSEQGVDLTVQGVTFGFVYGLNRNLKVSYGLKVENL